mmetsp:Transcript_18399/g.40926  ORF Transcript_18399/g.40926 Transcript_18399/m.40926 type:complete len:206 (+) Transcript_18399:546-1163(+)
MEEVGESTLLRARLQAALSLLWVWEGSWTEWGPTLRLRLGPAGEDPSMLEVVLDVVLVLLVLEVVLEVVEVVLEVVVELLNKPKNRRLPAPDGPVTEPRSDPDSPDRVGATSVLRVRNIPWRGNSREVWELFEFWELWEPFWWEFWGLWALRGVLEEGLDHAWCLRYETHWRNRFCRQEAACFCLLMAHRLGRMRSPCAAMSAVR